MRDLGVCYYELDQYGQARKYLLQAFKLNPRDGKTMTYLGLTLEAENKERVALLVYKRFTKVPRLSPYRQTMAMRYRLLHRHMIQAEMRQLLKQEENLNPAAVPANSIAVFPFTYQGKDQKFSALGLGLSEMMITDLSQVPGLMLVERVRLQALLEEVALGQSGLVDESTAPRFGKLLSAAKIIHGNFDVLASENLSLDVAYWDVLSNTTPEFSSKQDALDNVFKLEKDMVFHVIADMGIELTPEVREKIQRIPTKNIQAFLAYCMGLEKEDGEQFEAAMQYYQLAVKLDPQFREASAKMEESRTMLQADNLHRPAIKADHPGKKELSPQHELVRQRLSHLNNSLGAYFIPGRESRESPQEAQNSGAEIFDDLPLPPKPPIRR
ncbi:MAG: tetratricopeptide repeat protein [candidate division KSB1 bacterium]|nr:tetratricopeptide repeat protein [candidate division KSB1 bacterium]